MANQATNYQCPACTGPLHFVGTSGKLECDYCGSSYEVAEIEAMFADKNESATRAMASQSEGGSEWSTDGMSQDWGSDAASMKVYSCPSCSAELICDNTTAATCCPYCGNQTVIPGNFSGALKPEFVIPFKTDKEMAKNALKEHYKGKKLLPKSFVDGNHIEEIQGVYVPFWMFDCETEGKMSFEASTSTSTKSGNTETITTKHYDVKRNGTLAFEKVPVDASTRMPDGHMDSIEPYDYSDLKPFSTAYMPGFLADKYDVEASECGKRMEERCKRTLEDKITETVTGYDDKKVTEKKLTVKKGDTHYAMLPVWLLATKWNDQNYLFAMNGQSGKLVGDLPCDKKAYWKYFGIYAVAFIAFILVLFNLILSVDMTGITFAIVEVIIPALLAFIPVSIMKGKLKSIVKPAAGNYVSKKGLVLSLKTDTFLRTTVEKKEIQKSN